MQTEIARQIGFLQQAVAKMRAELDCADSLTREDALRFLIGDAQMRIDRLREDIGASAEGPSRRSG